MDFSAITNSLKLTQPAPPPTQIQQQPQLQTKKEEEIYQLQMQPPKSSLSKLVELGQEAPKNLTKKTVQKIQDHVVDLKPLGTTLAPYIPFFSAQIKGELKDLNPYHLACKELDKNIIPVMEQQIALRRMACNLSLV